MDATVIMFNQDRIESASEISKLPSLMGTKGSFPKLPSKYDPYLNDPRLARHVILNNQGAVVNARLCHDLFALPYDKHDIGKVPFNRTYKREKLLLLDNPVTRTHSIRQSLTNPSQHLTVTSRELVAQSVARIKKIYSKNNPIVLDFTSDKAKTMKCFKIEKSLPKGHPLAKRPRHEAEGRRKDELLDYEEDVKRVANLDGWENRLASTKQRQVSQK